MHARLPLPRGNLFVSKTSISIESDSILRYNTQYTKKLLQGKLMKARSAESFTHGVHINEAPFVRRHAEIIIIIIILMGHDFFRELDRRTTFISGDVFEPRYLFHRLSILIQRFNSVLLHESFSPELPPH